MPVEPPRSVCDSLAVISPPAASFLGASAGQWNHGTGDPKSRFVSLLSCFSGSLSTSGYGEGAMEKKVWRVGPICAMENLGMVGGLSPQFGPQLLSITPDLRLSPWVLGAKLGVSPSPGNPWGGPTSSASLSLCLLAGARACFGDACKATHQTAGLGPGSHDSF